MRTLSDIIQDTQHIIHLCKQRHETNLTEGEIVVAIELLAVSVQQLARHMLVKVGERT